MFLARTRVALLLPLAASLALAACSKPEPPDRDDPPEPQAVAAAQPAELTQAIQEPLDKANAAQAATEAASKQQDAAIQDATGDAIGN